MDCPDEDEINENIRWFLEQKAKAEKAKLQEESNNSDLSRKQAA